MILMNDINESSTTKNVDRIIWE